MCSLKRSNLVALTLFIIQGSAGGADFQPIALTADSYNYDVVVEKGAPPPALVVTTASMEQGTTNQGFTWFERGYFPDWPSTGLPKAGSILTSDQSPDYQYKMPLSYEGDNAVLIDSVRTNSVITLVTPARCAVLSFLTSSGINRNTIRYTVHYQDGATETGTFISPNWYNEPNPAWATSGKVNVTTFVHSDLTAYNPRLYSVDVTLSNASAVLSSIDLALQSGSGHTAIFAVSAAALSGAAFAPLEIAGFNEDIVIEGSAAKTGFLNLNTTGTMENGTNNSGFTLYEQGYNSAAPNTGLPPAGSVITNLNDTTHRFALASSYSNANVILIDSPKTNPVVRLASPASYSQLSLLTASSEGAQTNVYVVVRHADGNSETNVIVSPDWLGSGPAALTVGGRVNVSTRLVNTQNPELPRFYAVDVPVIDQHSPVKQVTFGLGASAPGHTVVLALAGTVASTTPPIRPVLTLRPEPNGKLTFTTTQPGRLESCPILGASRLYWRDEGPILQSLTLNRTQIEPVRFYRVVLE